MGLKESAKPLAAEKRVLEQKWTKDVIAAGYTVLPSIILKRQKKLGLDPLDINILLHLVSYWWKGSDLPYPSKNSLAEAIGVDPSTIRRRIQRLEAASYIQRIERRTVAGGSRTNRYDLGGLIKAIQPLAKDELQAISKRQLEKQQRIASKKSPALSLVKG
jgi:DNA-binding MarR family transcriptional regulator